MSIEATNKTISIKTTYSVINAIDELKQKKKVSSWQLVQQLLSHHSEYGGKQGESVAKKLGPSQTLSKPAEKWLEEVEGLFDPETVKELHGRLLILGLCELDLNLKDFLNKQDFLKPLTSELREDFESLLIPKTGDISAYRHIFMKLLQNKPVKNQKPRKEGFLVIANGGPGLQGLSELCHRQVWNSPLTARYIVGLEGGFEDALKKFCSDLKAIKDRSETFIGDLLPYPPSEPERWKKLAECTPKPDSNNLLSVLGIEQPLDQFLSVGQRLVLLIEFRRVPEDATLGDIGLARLVPQLEKLPERVGIVFSGLPSSVTHELVLKNVTALKLPSDREPKYGQALANDIPAGPDQLNIISEVNALAEAITLKEMKPPMVVGVMGGWGAGKSFVLHLLENRVQEIRCEPVGPISNSNNSDFPYVGHPYLIRFDAWTYAKGNLWASLMQQIFVELDRQIGLEQALYENLADDISENQASEIWRVLSRLTNNERDRLLKTELGTKALNIVSQFDQGQITESRLWGVLKALKNEEIDQLKLATTEMEEMRIKWNQAKEELLHTIDIDIEQDARNSAWVAVGDNFLKQAWIQWAQKSDSQREPPTFLQIEQSIQWYKKLYKERSSVTAAFVLFALAGTIITSISDMGDIGVLLTGVISVFGAIWNGTQCFQEWVSDAARQFEQTVSSNRQHGEIKREEIADKAVWLVRNNKADEELQPKIAEKAGIFSKLEKEFTAKKADVQTRQQRIGIIARHENLLDFVKQRLEGKFYEDKLGLLHQVKSDLEDLSEALLGNDLDKKLFPRENPRVILLIDDLDRCPPNKVVEVLEAAQLLVKTPLFVVVIAMDVRYVTRALEKEYAGVLACGGNPSGLDYIEKIIQIPYRVRPISEQAVSGFLLSLMSPEKTATDIDSSQNGIDQQHVDASPPDLDNNIVPDNGDQESSFSHGERSRAPVARPLQSELRVLPTKAVHFSTDDHKLISSCCASFEVSPRALKRLVNVFKLFKIIWFRDGLDDGPDLNVKKAMLALLVIAAKFPDPMRQLLHAMERKYVGVDIEASEDIVHFLIEQCKIQRSNASITQIWDEVEIALNNPSLIPQELTFSQLHERHLRLVSTFSFIGESDPQREATLKKDMPSSSSAPTEEQA